MHIATRIENHNYGHVIVQKKEGDNKKRKYTFSLGKKLLYLKLKNTILIKQIL